MNKKTVYELIKFSLIFLSAVLLVFMLGWQLGYSYGFDIGFDTYEMIKEMYK